MSGFCIIQKYFAFFFELILCLRDQWSEVSFQRRLELVIRSSVFQIELVNGKEHIRCCFCIFIKYGSVIPVLGRVIHPDHLQRFFRLKDIGWSRCLAFRAFCFLGRSVGFFCRIRRRLGFFRIFRGFLRFLCCLFALFLTAGKSGDHGKR